MSPNKKSDKLDDLEDKTHASIAYVATDSEYIWNDGHRHCRPLHNSPAHPITVIKDNCITIYKFMNSTNSLHPNHNINIIMATVASQITSLMVVYSVFIQAKIKETSFVPNGLIDNNLVLV